MATSPNQPDADTPWLDRVPSWTFLAILGGVILASLLGAWLLPSLFWNPPEGGLEQGGAHCARGGSSYDGGGVVYDYFWWPILCDAGYNPVNTASWAVLLGLLLLWAYRLMNEQRERVDFGFIMGVVPYLVWGSVFRVLEDADLFAPYGRGLPTPETGTGFLDQNFGVFFITPLIYVEILFIAVGFLFLGYRARRVAQALGPAHGVRFFALSLVALYAFYLALWASDPTWVRFVANPAVALVGVLLAYAYVHLDTARQGRFSARVALGAYGIPFLVVGLWYVLLWMTGGTATWFPDAANPQAYTYPLGVQTDARPWPVQWWVLLAMVLAPGLVVYGCRRLGLHLGGATIPRTGPHDLQRKAGSLVVLLTVTVLVQGLAVFVMIVGLRDLAQRQLADAWTVNPAGYVGTIALLLAGPLAVWAGIKVAADVARRRGIHPDLLYYAHPVTLLMLFGQAIDGLMTSLGIDMFHYSEKHVVTGIVIGLFDALNLPGIFDQFPTALGLLPIKLLIVLMVVAAIDMSAAKDLEGRENLIGLVKLAIIMVGLSPGVRDGIRLAMAV